MWQKYMSKFWEMEKKRVKYDYGLSTLNPKTAFYYQQWIFQAQKSRIKLEVREDEELDFNYVIVCVFSGTPSADVQ